MPMSTTYRGIRMPEDYAMAILVPRGPPRLYTPAPYSVHAAMGVFDWERPRHRPGFADPIRPAWVVCAMRAVGAFRTAEIGGRNRAAIEAALSRAILGNLGNASQGYTPPYSTPRTVADIMREVYAQVRGAVEHGALVPEAMAALYAMSAPPLDKEGYTTFFLNTACVDATFTALGLVPEDL